MRPLRLPRPPWRRNAVHAASRALYKRTIGRWRYARGSDYAAQAYWSDRFRRYGTSLKGPGWESMTERGNEESYAQKEQVLAAALAEQGLTLDGRRVLEVGCGTGYWAAFVARIAPTAEYVGLDITDVEFALLKERFPRYSFVHGDVTESLPDIGRFDVVLMLDVIEHIVTGARLERAMRNLRSLLTPGGIYIVSGLARRESRPFFYLRWWTVARIREALPGFRVESPRSFAHKDNLLMLARAPSRSAVTSVHRSSTAGAGGGEAP